MGKSILVVDDDRISHRIIGRIFAGTDWRVETAEDGLNALASIITRPPDVLLLDLNMPLLDGWGLLAKIREIPRLCAMGIIIVSGEGAFDEQAAQYGLDESDFLFKPFKPGEVFSKVESAAMRAARPQATGQPADLADNPV